MSQQSFNDLQRAVITWAIEKGIFQSGNPEAQCLKTIEEVRELFVGIVFNKRSEIIDGLGDVLVTLIIQAEMQNLNLLDCLESAYEQIKNRTGQMIGGTFVKDEKK